MTTFQPGDRVRVVIEDAKVTMTSGDILWIDNPSGDMLIDPHDSGITVTKVAPQPQVGEVWELADGLPVAIFDGAIEEHEVVSLRRNRRWRSIAHVNFTGARKIYPLDQATVALDNRGATFTPDEPRTRHEHAQGGVITDKRPYLVGEDATPSDAKSDARGCLAKDSDGGWLKQKRDKFGRIWVQDKPDSDRYRMFGGFGTFALKEVEDYGPLTDLDPVRAGEEMCDACEDAGHPGACRGEWLKRFLDRKSGERTWTETAPGSGLYNYLARRLDGGEPMRRAHIKSLYGIARDLDPVRAGEEGKA